MNIRVVACLTFSTVFITVTYAENTCQDQGQELLPGVPDSALTASSSFSIQHGPNKARLHTGGAWCSIVPGESWIQVQLETEERILKIQTQGDNAYYFVPSFYVSISTDCISFNDYMENGRIRLFKENQDASTVVTNTLKKPPVARCVRIKFNKMYWTRECLKFELIGASSYRIIWNNVHYKLIEEKVSWLDATAYCKWKGGRLVTIDSIAENKWLGDCLNTITEGAEDMWIGLNRIENHYHWVTSQDDRASFYNWHSLQPNRSDAAENCALMSHSGPAYKWFSKPCEKKHYFICEE